MFHNRADTFTQEVRIWNRKVINDFHRKLPGTTHQHNEGNYQSKEKNQEGRNYHVYGRQINQHNYGIHIIHKFHYMNIHGHGDRRNNRGTGALYPTL